MSLLGKRDLKSRQGEIRTSVIGTVARVAQNSSYDLNELKNRESKRKYDKSSILHANLITEFNSRIVACVMENEPAMYYKASLAKDRKLVGNLGRQPFVWTAINGLSIQVPDAFSKKNFELFPFSVKLEFFLKEIEFRGLMTTSWQQDSMLAGVTHNKMPVTKAGTAMIHPMYPTTIVTGDTIVVTLPSDQDVKKKSSTPNRDEDKYLMAFKSMRDALRDHDDAIKQVLAAAERVFDNAKSGATAGGVAPTATEIVTYISTNLDNYIGLDNGVANIMLIRRDLADATLENLTTPFKLLYYSLDAVDTVRTLNIAPAVDDFGPVKKFMLGNAKIHMALHDRDQLLRSNRVGLALTSGQAGQPIDVLVGR